MSEANDEFEELKERAEEALLEYLEEKFEELVLTCEDRIGPPDEYPVCFYNESDCRFSTCPRIKPPHNMASSYPKKKRRCRMMIDAETKKKWLTKLFPGIHWNKGEVCKYCYSNPPSWSVYGGEPIERCSYCGNVKVGGTIAPWEIPDSELKRLMKGRIWR